MRLNPRIHLHDIPFRVRLATAIGAVVLLAGVVLLVFVVVLARYGTAQQIDGMEIRYGGVTGGVSSGPAHSTGTVPAPTGAGDRGIEVRKIDRTVQAVQDTALRQTVLWSAVGLMITAVLAGVLGWWLAGRALRPVASMTAAARRISEQNLHQRLALTGPDDELHRLADTFDTMLDRLEGAFESQRRFVANASHELKTPLAVQRASIEVGLADPVTDGIAEVREDLLTANREAEQLINALLLLARSDRGLDDTESVDLARTAHAVAAEHTVRATRHGVTLDVTAPAPLTVVGNPLLLRHLLANLVHNAVQYNHPGGRVRVRVEDRTVTVTNTGPHVPQDRVADLFEPFRRHARDRTATDGHGLGLSIVRSISRAHDAALTAEAGKEGGLTVALHFP
ncbi:HAMP domain-containing histidine kinase [Streptomyces olivaceus]|uniref:sensor histidine kinase n=1 Tax=Streptomyces TaxID=1883 RepID=UPI001CCADB47|nr:MULTISPECIES: ATP-binding protein [Streptomyces]MBZ6135903.1 HAMP domain-containing histidine kinase [Streptomyces olivaceus]MBZ6164099.1 HAMP domain-containing histidine kinase [Streptomyces olivaceus]MBZ6170508.1 HAMP domain-containing histidine kinase [Streptomyces olivaceus]MBZ6178066.1 HAMP domain-containing histidine kinase [Streptomyces olivaceus]MBZ6257180.1 HAMP domain-containing histidine kinase [Streptomyces olivaceus]